MREAVYHGVVKLHDLIPFWPDKSTYFMPWIKFRTEEGDLADGPMVRQGLGRREILVWTEKAPAEAAARDLALQTRGSWQVKSVSRSQVEAECRKLKSFGSRVVAVILNS